MNSKERLDEFYEYIKDKLDYAISRNNKRQHIVSHITLSSQIYILWKVIMEYFLPDTESAKQNREDKFN